MADRYAVYPFSQSSHCCFEATVVDTTKPCSSGYVHVHKGNRYTDCAEVCECFDIEDAKRIAAALNTADRLANESNVEKLTRAIMLDRNVPGLWPKQVWDHFEAEARRLLERMEADCG